MSIKINNMKKIFLMIIFISYFISNGITQEYYEMEKDEENNKEEGRNILYGFYFGELFSGGYGRIGFKLEPFICYRPVYRFRLAAGPLYNFEKKSRQAARHAYGADVFSEIIFIKKLHKVVPVDLLAHAEYQVVSLPKPDDRNNRQ